MVPIVTLLVVMYITSYQELVEFFGNESRMAGALGIARQAVYKWNQIIPEGRAWQLQALTQGRFDAARYLLDRNRVDESKAPA